MNSLVPNVPLTAGSIAVMHCMCRPAELGNESGIQNICYAPLSSPFRGPVTSKDCVLQSVWGWWQNDKSEFSYEDNEHLDKILQCSR